MSLIQLDSQFPATRLLPVSATLLLLGVGVSMPNTGWAESDAHRDTLRSSQWEDDGHSRWQMAPRVSVAIAERMEDEHSASSLRSVVLARPSASVPAPSGNGSARHFGHALVGSTVGAAVGAGIGLLLIQGAKAEGRDDHHDHRWSNTETDAAAVLSAAGLCALVAGGPIGAVEGAGIEDRRRDAYVVAGVGELVLGLLGYSLAGGLGEGTGVRLFGLATGAVFGSAAGASLLASKVDRGAVRYGDGTWEVALPEVEVRPRLGMDGSPAVNVTLMSVQL